MAGKIPIGDARQISRERGCPIVVIFGVEDGGGWLHDGRTFPTLLAAFRYWYGQQVVMQADRNATA